ncbi:MAG: L-serine ammonia-lyase, iron-sulfur-dependent, subunit alpha [Anaerolineales bacterium]
MHTKRSEKIPLSSYPSIFNDVIGPVMRGPSSSHCAAALRIGRIARALMDGKIAQVIIEFDPEGSLATTHQSQGSEMGLFGGFLGWEATDARLANSPRAIQEAGIQVTTRLTALGDVHPNTYQITLGNLNEQHMMTAISTGGGMIEVVAIDHFKVSMAGDCYETLFYLDSNASEVADALRGRLTADAVHLIHGPAGNLIEVKTHVPPDPTVLSKVCERYGLTPPKILPPVLPVLSKRGMTVPFITCQEMLEYNQDKDLEPWELAICYEGQRGGISHEQVFRQMKDIVRLMQASIQEGRNGTHFDDRILGAQSVLFREGIQQHRLLDAGVLNRIILDVTAMMEMKSAMGVIVAAPTAGACGGLPGACIGAAEVMGLGEDEITKALLAAGLTGIFIAAHATFAAEVGGCQAECGSGSGMTAAALVTLAGGTTQQAMDAASMALQNILGMICDPVAGRVEVPCLGKNILAASNALACANMALAGYDPVIPLDEVIEVMDQVGKSLPRALRCTALGGLSTTRTARTIEARLERRELNA